YLAGDIFYIEDLNSTNGTYVNGKRIIKAGIHHNDIIGIVKHALVFIDDRPSANPTNVESSKPQAESTMVLSNDHKNLLATAGVESAKKETVGLIKVVEGIVDKTEYLLTGLSTYIGKSDRVQIPIKGSGLFGNAPEVAAMIARRPDGYYLVAMKEGYPKLNGKNLTGRELLKEGDLIELGSTIFQFFIQSEPKSSAPGG
ncbi:MAG: FHA domain-containing protein, partial [Elusimicrobia bacterium]|nr:FHA domain-containing protein [Elusimicrobiota bacterium]